MCVSVKGLIISNSQDSYIHWANSRPALCHTGGQVWAPQKWLSMSVDVKFQSMKACCLQSYPKEPFCMPSLLTKFVHDLHWQ